MTLIRDQMFGGMSKGIDSMMKAQTGIETGADAFHEARPASKKQPACHQVNRYVQNEQQQYVFGVRCHRNATECELL